MKKNINLIMGGFALHFQTWGTIIEFLKQYPYIMEEDVSIRSLFDNFGGCTWNCGSTMFTNLTTKPYTEFIVNYFKENNIPIRLTMTNPLIEERDLYDRYANMIMETCQNDLNEVLVASPLLEEYIRDKYPQYKICRSIIAAEEIPYDISDKYEMSVLRRKYNNDWKFLKSIPKDKRNKIEILCNESCIEDCPRQYSHYEALAKSQMTFDSMLEECKCSHFENGGRTEFLNCDLLSRKTYVSPEKIREKYLPLGFENFKLSGRHEKANIIEDFAKYAIKPEYQQDFRIHIWNAITQPNMI